MSGLKALFLVGGALVAMTSLSQAADLLPPAPAIEPPPPATQDFSGWYLRGDVGLAMQTGKLSPSISPNPLVGQPADAFNSFYNPSIGTSVLFDVGVGYEINNWFRVDVTGEYRGGAHFQTLEQVAIPSQNYQNANFYRGEVSSFIGMVNGYVDLGTWWCVTPFVGAGVGVAANSLSGLTDTGFTYLPNGLGSQVGYPTGGYFSDKTTTSLAWALMAGLDFDVTKNLKLELGYRFMDYGKVASGPSHCFNGTGQGGGFSVAQCGGSSSFLSTRDLISQDFRLGLRWALNDTYTTLEPEPLVRKY
jgi:opacity protein-like surface antigen